MRQQEVLRLVAMLENERRVEEVEPRVQLALPQQRVRGAPTLAIRGDHRFEVRVRGFAHGLVLIEQAGHVGVVRGGGRIVQRIGAPRTPVGRHGRVRADADKRQHEVKARRPARHFQRCPIRSVERQLPLGLAAFAVAKMQSNAVRIRLRADHLLDCRRQRDAADRAPR